jgi:hypothetical protein
MPTPQLRAITTRQPWAELIAAGLKTVENRSRRTHHRVPVAIHAGLATDHNAMGDQIVLRDLARLQRPSRIRTLGAIIAVAGLVDCHHDAGCCRPWGQPDVRHLVLANIRRVEPVPARGSLTLPWTAPPEAAEQIWGRLAEEVRCV